MASGVEQQIRNNAARNRELLDMLANTDGADSTLAEHNRYLEDLRKQIRNSDIRIRKLNAEREKRLGERDKYRDSHVRRFMFKASGKKEKFEQRAEDGEREYFQALQDSHQEESVNSAIKTQLDEGERAEPELQQNVDRHNAAQMELDVMYKRIFDGPTPQFPEEDAREQRFTAAKMAHQRTRALYDAETQAVDELNRADQCMAAALREVESALGFSRMDMFGGGAMSDMMERNHLSQADRQAMMARMHTDRAQRASPHVRDLPDVSINHGNIMSDVFFDNIVTDYRFHQEIKRGQAELLRCYNALQDIGNSADRRRMDLETQLKGQEQELTAAREELQRARERVFQSVARGEGGAVGGGFGGDGNRGMDNAPSNPSDLPPAYDTSRGPAPAYDEKPVKS